MHLGSASSWSRGWSQPLRWALLTALVMYGSGCSIRTYALRATADALSGGNSGLGSDDDPELVKDAAPFGLKTLEQLAEALPDHRPLRLSLASGFTQYSYAFIHQPADFVEDKNIAQAREMYARSRRLYLRARDYALRGLDLAHKGAAEALRSPDKSKWQPVLESMQKDDVPYLYWAAASLGLAISTAKNNPDLIGDLPLVEALMGRARALDADYDEGSIWEFYVSFDSSRNKQEGGGPEQAKADMDRALKLCGGKKIGSIVSYAETVLVAQQNKAEFTRLLKQVLATDISSEDPTWRKNRLANVLNQQRAQWLLAKTSDLFAE